MRGHEQFRRLVDEARGVVAADEARVRDHLVEEAQVGHHAADAELPQRAMHARDRLGRRRRPGRDLHQQRIVGAGDDCAGVGGARVEPHAEAGGAPVGGEPAVVGHEAVFRILGGHAALQRVGVKPDVLLRRHAAVAAADARAGGNADLRLDQVDAGYHLGHRVLDLDARIDLDEVKAAGGGVLQEFDRAGVAIVGGAADAQRRRAQLGALRVTEERSRRALDHLLVAALHGAIALVKMHQPAVAVAQQLHLDVARLAHQLFEIHLVVAERGPGFGARQRQRCRERGLVVDDAHAASAAAPAGLEHHRVADRGGMPRAQRQVRGQSRRRRHHRNAGGRGKIAGAQLVAEHAHGRGLGADEDDAGARAGLGELRALGQEAIAGVDGIGPGLHCSGDDFVDIEICLQRALAFADQVGLVGLGAVEREAIFLRVDRDRGNAELGGGAHHADGNLAAIGNQQAAEGRGHAEAGSIARP